MVPTLSATLTDTNSADNESGISGLNKATNNKIMPAILIWEIKTGQDSEKAHISELIQEVTRKD